jgi:hypothetical protein
MSFLQKPSIFCGFSCKRYVLGCFVEQIVFFALFLDKKYLVFRDFRYFFC